MAAEHATGGGLRKARRKRPKWRAVDHLALQTLQSLPGTYVPWSKHSLRPAALAVVLNDIVTNDRRTVVECGSGVSTVYMARVLQQRGGRVHALEHDPRWAASVEGILVAEGLSEVASVMHAPLQTHPLALEGNEWYAGSTAERLLQLEIDLLLVDGPPGGARRRLSRYPALPFFRQALSEDRTVVLDDVHRPGEQELLERWEEAGPPFRTLNRLNIAVASTGLVSSL